MKIFADSACDLPLDFFAENEVELFPLSVLLDGKEYEDIVEINSKEVFDAIRQGQQPKTSQASPDQMMTTWKDLAASGEDGIYIAFSSQLSGTYQTAVMTSDQVKEDNPSMNLAVIDTHCASLGYGLLVKEAVRLRNEGIGMREIEQEIRTMATHMEHLFTVEDLDYLAKGGRVSKASAFFGGLLNIKPLLHVEDGKLVPIEKHRGRKKVLRRMIEMMEERGSNLQEQTIAISHGDDLSTAKEFQEMIQEVIQPKAIEIHQIGSVIGSHAGPGTIALFFLNNTKSE
ncbi:fatty acid-binding protein DegV [Sporosarcina sp. P12(2017)]|uniref:DegV family protein n=1 Tax=unclassified Sporosarcina TaxID=2647733 RepID=UPI000C165F9D|nr:MULTISPECIES: DegV family protein [unclassified Sporosarcina]PIC56187.1 fatty acid-binding protein DegV [Sporosarcina sp. P10]PIC60077.1 fatty acid-binding protein DegV [Sporosarcina sp. P12(2017)]